MSREQILLDSVEHFIRTHEEWADGNETELTDVYEEALKEMVAEFASGDMPGRLREVERAVETVGMEYTAFERYVTQSNKSPRKEFWDSIESLRGKLAGAVSPPPMILETIPQLVKQGVTPAQIAKIYSHQGRGPFMVNGHPRPDLVSKEIDDPGSVLPPDFVHPEVSAKQEAEKEAEQRRAARVKERFAATVTGPESIEDLLRQGLTIKQICKVKGCEPTEVLAESERLGIAPAEPINLASQRAPHEPAISDSDARAMDATVRKTGTEAVTQADPSPEPTEAETIKSVMELHQEGFGSKDIAAELKITIQKAAAIIRSNKDKPEWATDEELSDGEAESAEHAETVAT